MKRIDSIRIEWNRVWLVYLCAILRCMHKPQLAHEKRCNFGFHERFDEESKCACERLSLSVCLFFSFICFILFVFPYLKLIENTIACVFNRNWKLQFTRNVFFFFIHIVCECVSVFVCWKWKTAVGNDAKTHKTKCVKEMDMRIRLRIAST